MRIEIIIEDMLSQLRKIGVIAQVTTCLNSKGEIVSFETKIVGFED